MKYLTIMLITLTTGDEHLLVFNGARACGDALPYVEAAAGQIGVKVDAAACFETVAPATSIRPKRKPEAI